MRGGWRVQPTAFLNTAEVPENHFTAEENKTRSRMRYWLVTPNRNPCVFLSLRRPNIDALDELALENEVERYRRDEAKHRRGEDETIIGRVLRREADETRRTIGLEKSDAMQLEDAPAAVQAIGEAAWQVNRDAMLLCYGGSIATPEDAGYVLARCDADGFVGTSSMERLPVEVAIAETTRAFKSVLLKERGR